ncbi:MAG: hypothetical protein H8Z69_02310 [Nanohaloarchaea archaeon]|nr:hypothetical protein [Candidatus Nanohaloarchaea archaeon]
MSAAEMEHVETLDRDFDYVSEIENLLKRREIPLKSEDIRIELEYGENGLVRPADFGADEVQSYVDNAIESIEERSEVGNIDLAITVDYESGEELYRIV